MVYKFDEYKKEFPNKNVTALNKFVNEVKNLHEMSTDELNAIIASWGGTTYATAMNRKSMIKLYLNWLTKNGVEVKANPEDIVVPLKTTEFFIYSSENLHEYWGKYLESCEFEATKTGEYHSRERYLTSYVANILSFYGLTLKQILDINLDDVNPNGIAGYDIPLTKADIDVLLEYKGLNEFANKKKVGGKKYIRSTGVVSESTLDYGITHGACGEDGKWLKHILSCRNLYKLGRFAKIYETEQRNGKLVDCSNRAVPADWFIKEISLIVGREAKSGRLTSYKKIYDAYRAERMEYEAQHNKNYVAKIDESFKQIEKTVEKPDVSGLLEALKYVNKAISEVDRVKVNLLGIKAQIQKFVKK